jgi:membrane protease YdiL (CAAX protease family)
METSALGQSESGRYRWIASPFHMILVLALAGVSAWRGAIASEQMRAVVNPDRIHIYTRTLFFEWLMFTIVIVGVRFSGSSLLTVLGKRWSSAGQLLRDIGIAAAYWIVSTLILSIAAGHAQGTAPDRAVQFLLPQGGLEMTLWTAVSVSAGICEETVYRGYLQRQFIALTKSVPAGIILSAAAFGAAHAYKGFWGAAHISLEGVMLGILAHWRGSVRPGMISHAWGDFFAGVLARVLKIRIG